MSTEAKSVKKALRKDVKARLSTLSAEDVTKQSQAAQELILSLPQYKNAKSISVYLSMPVGETQTHSILRDAFEAGKKVYVPYIYRPDSEGSSSKRKVMDMLQLSSLSEYDGLERDPWGIPTLPEEGIRERCNAIAGRGLTQGLHLGGRADEDGGLDLVVVPGVGFDADGNRMGHGAGFYDSYLTRFCDGEGGSKKRPFLVGLCLAEQVLERGRILMQEWDWKVDVVAVGDGRLIEVEKTE
ncbi:putative 5-formyltetrahydrofolate cyclo-ligase [Teratosphaeria destructans]|uniref:5-formyltetrahydrofolate cyclo-ligase n=1 Tax=Teratosphaeria destructans TaxID=418781 RepID=A0A9W7T130_9PEZI|nr:putative 5-formyltetrahydrofolate cyclo-ligase [Teratosphaeria destructans]